MLSTGVLSLHISCYHANLFPNYFFFFLNRNYQIRILSSYIGKCVEMPLWENMGKWSPHKCSPRYQNSWSCKLVFKHFPINKMQAKEEEPISLWSSQWKINTIREELDIKVQAHLISIYCYQGGFLKKIKIKLTYKLV